MRVFPVTPQPSIVADEINYSITSDFQHFTGSTLVVGETVFLSDGGVEVLASTDGSYYAVNAYSFLDASRSEIGGMYARDDTGQNVVGFRAVDEAQLDDNTVLEIASTSTTAAQVTISIQANRSGESTDTYITLERSAASEIDILTNLASGRVRITPKLNLMGAAAEPCDIYIKDSYLIIKYNDAGTTRYKYLDLSGTAVTWQHSTAGP